MKKILKIINLLFILLLGLLASCQSIKDGLEGNKKSKSAEEFLIQKKNPLVLPPDYSILPLPETVSDEEQKSKKEFDLEKILKKDTKKNTVKSNSSLKKSIIEKIQNN
tara:strand:- start:11 stop:334 length:324 start_codon:yes stop_codon:yes gene_type:complete